MLESHQSEPNIDKLTHEMNKLADEMHEMSRKMCKSTFNKGVCSKIICADRNRCLARKFDSTEAEKYFIIGNLINKNCQLHSQQSFIWNLLSLILFEALYSGNLSIAVNFFNQSLQYFSWTNFGK